METSVTQVDEGRTDNREPFCKEGSFEYRAAPDAPQAVPEKASASTVYPDYVKQLLDGQESKLASVESRGGSVVTVSGTLVTLLLGIASLVTRLTTYTPSPSAKHLLAAAAVAFLLAGLSAIGTYVPWRVWALDPSAMTEQLWERWDAAGDIPVEKVTATRLAQWKAARQLTQRKAVFLMVAVATQVVGVVLAALSAVMTLMQ